MLRPLSLAGLVPLLVLTSAARAQSPDDGSPVNLILGAASGYSIPLGSVEDGAPSEISGLVKGFVPIEFEAGLQLWSSWRLLGYVGVGTLVRDKFHCATAVDCGGSRTHAGAKLGYAFSGPAGWVFTVALGAGWHRIHLSTATASTSTEATATGVEGILELAAIYRLTLNFGLGPFLGTGIYSSSGWTNVVDGQTSESPGNHVNGSLSFGLKLEVRI